MAGVAMASPIWTSSDKRDKERSDDDGTTGYDFVRFTLADIHGIARSKLIPGRHVAERLNTGIAMFSAVTGLGTRSEIPQYSEMIEVNYSNAVVRPMPGTLHALPWATGGKYRIGEVFCESSWMPPYRDGAPQGTCTRYMARTQLERLSALGYQLMSGYEAEFFMYRKDGIGELTSRPMFHGVDIFSNVVQAEHDELICSMVEGLSAAGIDVVALNNEYASGQLEFTTGTKFGIESADQMFSLKESVKEIGVQRGWRATFMTKPTSGPGCCSGMHFSGSLWAAGKNAFHDPETGRLSAVGRHWAAGLIKHAAALTALLSPTVNCYGRLHKPFAPDRADCGWENRYAMLRIVTVSPQMTYVENRLPSSAANPYVVLAATVAAGIDGLTNRLELAEDHGETLPSSLSEALAALESDKVLCEALGEDFVRWFLTVKREVEITKVNEAKAAGRDEMDIERELYFTFL